MKISGGQTDVDYQAVDYQAADYQTDQDDLTFAMAQPEPSFACHREFFGGSLRYCNITPRNLSLC